MRGIPMPQGQSPKERHIKDQRISHENYPPLMDMMMGADAPMPPVLMNAAAPDGAPPRRIRACQQI